MRNAHIDDSKIHHTHALAVSPCPIKQPPHAGAGGRHALKLWQMAVGKYSATTSTAAKSCMLHTVALAHNAKPRISNTRDCHSRAPHRTNFDILVYSSPTLPLTSPQRWPPARHRRDHCNHFCASACTCAALFFDFADAACSIEGRLLGKDFDLDDVFHDLGHGDTLVGVPPPIVVPRPAA